MLIAGAAPLSLQSATQITAAEVVRRIQSELGGDWPSTGPDGFKAGDPSRAVKRIATTAMATADVLKQAVKSDANLILTYEPTFYSRADTMIDDPLVKAKREFIEKNGLVVFRLRDHWQTFKGDHMTAGLAKALGWSSHGVKNDDGLYEIPPATAEATVATVRRKLNLRGGLRVVGDRKAVIRRVLVFPGSMPTATMWQRYSDVDMIVAGEVREWENTHYAADIFTAGEKRVLVTTGRVASEEPGMKACAEWINTTLKDVSAKWIGSGDPYWRPS